VRQTKAFLKSMLDAIPLPVLVVDRDVKVVEFNEAAAPLVERSRKRGFRRPAGEFLGCLHAHSGCGNGLHCADCVIRGAVLESFEGRKLVRERARMERVDGGRVRMTHLLVTTSLFECNEEPFVLLTLEDISDLLDLKRLVPICASCKKVRDDHEAWHQVEAYISDHLPVDFSHGLCPECISKHYSRNRKGAAFS
jgi:PAS domain-containing protein